MYKSALNLLPAAMQIVQLLALISVMYSEYKKLLTAQPPELVGRMHKQHALDLSCTAAVRGLLTVMAQKLDWGCCAQCKWRRGQPVLADEHAHLLL